MQVVHRQYGTKQIRFLKENDGAMWVPCVDVARAIGYSNPTELAKYHSDRPSVLRLLPDVRGNTVQCRILPVSEIAHVLSGLQSGGSRRRLKRNAEAFTRWLAAPPANDSQMEATDSLPDESAIVRGMKFYLGEQQVHFWVDCNGAVWCLGFEAALALGYANPAKAIWDHCHGQPKYFAHQEGVPVESRLIGESDLFRLLDRSWLPGAAQVRAFVLSAVLPALRATETLTPQYSGNGHEQGEQASILAFNGHQIQMFTDRYGLVMFAARDLAAALGYRSPAAKISTIFKGQSARFHYPASGKRGVRLLNVREALHLCNVSRSSAAPQLRAWVASFGEQPTSTVPQPIKPAGDAEIAVESNAKANAEAVRDQIAAILLVSEHLSKIPGVKPGMAAAAAMECIRENTGIDLSSFRKALPAVAGRVCALNATAVGRRLGVAAQDANRLLAARGFQTRNARGEWQLTRAGQQYGEAFPFARGGHSGYQVLWSADVLAQLKPL